MLNILVYVFPFLAGGYAAMSALDSEEGLPPRSTGRYADERQT